MHIWVLKRCWYSKRRKFDGKHTTKIYMRVYYLNRWRFVDSYGTYCKHRVSQTPCGYLPIESVSVRISWEKNIRFTSMISSNTYSYENTRARRHFVLCWEQYLPKILTPKVRTWNNFFCCIVAQNSVLNMPLRHTLCIFVVPSVGS